MTDTGDIRAAGALDELVHQFQDPLSFYRELIQNSIDAGTAEIHLRTDFEPGRDDPDRGVLIIRIRDWGEGMNRKIIDSRLTRLFSSAKDGDLSKIGRFGIGFVSVFGIEPDGVVVDTSRDGEDWRVVFDADRSFTRILRDEPTEGTLVRVFKTMSRDEAEGFAERSRRVIANWCEHVHVEVRFNDERIDRPFGLGTPVEVRRETPGTRLCVGLRSDLRSVWSCYNQGLTLVRGELGTFRHVSWKADSRHLEHNLTRDDLIRDEGFDTVMAAVREAAASELPEELWRQTEERVLDGADDETLEFYRFAALSLMDDGCFLDPTPERRLFPVTDGAPPSLAEAFELLRDERLFTAPESTPLTRALTASGRRVLRMLPDTPTRRLWRLLCERHREDADIKPAGAVFYLALPFAAGEERTSWVPLCEAVAATAAAVLKQTLPVEPGHLGSVGFGVDDHWVLPMREWGRPEAVLELYGGPRRKPAMLVLNTDHAAVRRLKHLAEAEPELAGYLTVKKLLLARGLKSRHETALLDAAVSERGARVRRSPGEAG